MQFVYHGAKWWEVVPNGERAPAAPELPARSSLSAGGLLMMDRRRRQQKDSAGAWNKPDSPLRQPALSHRTYPRALQERKLWSLRIWLCEFCRCFLRNNHVLCAVVLLLFLFCFMDLRQFLRARVFPRREDCSQVVVVWNVIEISLHPSIIHLPIRPTLWCRHGTENEF